jgi:hypothetical protein
MVGNSDIDFRSLRAESSTESNGTQTAQVLEDFLKKFVCILTPAKYRKGVAFLREKTAGQPMGETIWRLPRAIPEM